MAYASPGTDTSADLDTDEKNQMVHTVLNFFFCTISLMISALLMRMLNFSLGDSTINFNVLFLNKTHNCCFSILMQFSSQTVGINLHSNKVT
jgi:hypothetical protein